MPIDYLFTNQGLFSAILTTAPGDISRAGISFILQLWKLRSSNIYIPGDH